MSAMMLRRALSVAVVLGAGLAVGCGPDCQSTCNRVYGESECGIAKPGRSPQELVRDCNASCDAAIEQAGDLGDYDPTRRRTSATAIVLENDKQAAAWMDCVWDVAPDATPEQCAQLDPAAGLCAPI